MEGLHDPKLVALSVAVAILASYAALDLAGRVNASSGWKSWIWLVGGALSMGAGIWSMHFIGMLAFKLPIPVVYDLPISLVSMLFAIVVSGVALFILRKPMLGTGALTTGATLMGFGICAMHYTGMIAMQLSPPIRYDPLLFMASVLIAIGASMAALWIAFRLRKKYSGLAIVAKLGGATVMGMAIAGMHYTGMAAARFAPDSFCLGVSSGGGIDSASLAVGIGVITIAILAVTLVISSLDAHFAAKNARLAVSLQIANEQLRNIALYDNLTGLPNRLLLEDRMHAALAHVGRSGHSFALLFVDLDRFKPVNDSHGHRVGDELLRLVGARVRALIRAEDTVGRTGGDEFLVILHEMFSADDAALISDKILAELNRPFHVDGRQIEISCSIGISVCPRDGTDIPTLIANADAAMYDVKKSGRNGYRFYLPGVVVPRLQGSR
ncbi:MAG TPA: MHYT domain-containing protein [Burkholderiales bacterium]|nr:MHYT domain-containing protein [Burkholderiales bacterium]